VILQTVKIT